jgi:hypothetical protein
MCYSTFYQEYLQLFSPVMYVYIVTCLGGMHDETNGY